MINKKVLANKNENIETFDMEVENKKIPSQKMQFGVCWDPEQQWTAFAFEWLKQRDVRLFRFWCFSQFLAVFLQQSNKPKPKFQRK